MPFVTQNTYTRLACSSRASASSRSFKTAPGRLSLLAQARANTFSSLVDPPVQPLRMAHLPAGHSPTIRLQAGNPSHSPEPPRYRQTFPLPITPGERSYQQGYNDEYGASRLAAPRPNASEELTRRAQTSRTRSSSRRATSASSRTTRTGPTTAAGRPSASRSTTRDRKRDRKSVV